MREHQGERGDDGEHILLRRALPAAAAAALPGQGHCEAPGASRTLPRAHRVRFLVTGVTSLNLIRLFSLIFIAPLFLSHFC